MYSIARAFASDTQARSAVAELQEQGFAPESIQLLAQGPAAGSDGTISPQQALSFGFNLRNLDTDKAEALFDAAMEGRSLVLVQARFGESLAAETVLGRHDPIVLAPFVEEAVPITRWDEGAPLSSALGLPVLIKRTPDPVLLKGPTFESIPQLTRPGFSLFGSGVMRDNPAPLSSMVGMGTLSKPKDNWKSSFGLPLLRSKAFVFGPSIIREPAPLSRLFRIPTII